MVSTDFGIDFVFNVVITRLNIQLNDVYDFL